MTRPVAREHARQKHAKLFVRDAITVAHEFFAFDRSKPNGRFTHAREKTRGLRRGTPDTLLRVAGMPAIWCEWKTPGEKPGAEQLAMLASLRALGDHATWATTVLAYAEFLHDAGVPMVANWRFIAIDHDARADGEIARADLKNGKLPKRYRAAKERPSASRIRAVNRLRLSVMF